MLKEKVIAAEKIQQVIATLAEEINADLEGRDPVFVGILKGAVYFMTALTLHLNRSVVVDFIQASSYGATTESSGTVTLIKDVTVDIAGKDVYVVEDIVDTGLTLADVVALLRARHPRSVQVVDPALQALAEEGGHPARLRGPRNRGPLRGGLRP